VVVAERASCEVIDADEEEAPGERHQDPEEAPGARALRPARMANAEAKMGMLVPSKEALVAVERDRR